MSDSSSPVVETHSRSLAKAVSWRVFAFLITTAVAWMLSENIAVALSIGFSDSLIKIGAYYLHERAWLGVRFGRKPNDASTPPGE